MNPGAKFHCSEHVWVKTATKAAVAAGLRPATLLSGARDRTYTALRWRLWDDLIARNYSFASIGRASGFNHTSVMYGVARSKIGVLPFRVPASHAARPTKAQIMGAR